MIQPTQKVRDISIVAALILGLLLTLIVVSSQRELSITTETQAHSTPTPTPTPKPQGPNKNQIGNTASPGDSTDSIPLVSDKQYITNTSSSIFTEMRVSDVLSNYTNDGLTIVWFTEAPTVSDIRLGFNPEILSRFLIDEYTQKSHYIHSVRANGLTPGRQYYYSGSRSRVQNFLLPDIKATGVPTSVRVKGNIKGFQKECLIRGYVERASSISTYATSVSLDGTWELDLSAVLHQDYSKYFIPSTEDMVSLDFFCVNAYGRKSIISATGRLDQFLGSTTTITLPAFE